jgi:uridine kinase
VQALESHWTPVNAVVLPIDAYYRGLAHLPVEERMQCNFDSPESIEWALLKRDLAALTAGEAIERPVYDYTAHARTKETIRLKSRPLVIVEGLFALWPDFLRRQAAARVYVDLPMEQCLARRIARDSAERGRSEAQVREQFERFVRPMAEQHVLPTRASADLVLPGDGSLKHAVERVANLLDQTLAAT